MKAKFFFLVILLQAVWIVATVAVQETRLNGGDVVLLETAPVDPRDYLRGDYITLRYKINSVPIAMLHDGTKKAPPAGTVVYVRLKKNGLFYVIESASLSPIQEEHDHPILRGKVGTSWFFDAGITSLEVEYGLERYYVREGTGNPRGKLTVEVAVSHSGAAVIRQVFIDGRPYAQAMRE